MPRVVHTPSYILTVGSMMPHKNVKTLVSAMDDQSLGDIDLLVVGPINDRQRTLFAEWRDAARKPSSIRHLGYVTVERLAELYAGAAVVALPSLHEGFGLTLLEAMKSGAPIVASSIPAHREIGGNAVMYVERPRSPLAWAHMLARVLDDGRLGETLALDGRSRTANITWEVIAEEMVTLARTVIAART